MEKCSVFHDWLVTHCSVWDFTTRPSENLNHVSTAFLISQLGPDCITLADICFAYFLFCCEYFKSFLKKKKKKWNLILAACFLPFSVCSGFFWAAITCHFTVLKAEDQWGLPGPQPQHLAIFLQRHPSGAVLNLSPQIPLLQCLERATCPWWPCLSRRLGPDDLQRRLPASAKLWFWFSSSGQALALPWHQTPPLLSSSFPAQVPTSDAPQLQQVVVGHRHQQSLVPFPSPMQETIFSCSLRDSGSQLLPFSLISEACSICIHPPKPFLLTPSGRTHLHQASAPCRLGCCLNTGSAVV